jgi:hypothetical protein
MEKAWQHIAADNLISILPFLVDPGEETPRASAAEVANRIETAFRDRITWNTKIYESELQWYFKIWLIVP